MTLIELLVVILFFAFLLLVICGIASIWIPALSLFNLKVWAACLTASPVFIILYILIFVAYEDRKNAKDKELISTDQENYSKVNNLKDNLDEIKLIEIKELINKYFSLQWCRDNYIVPISLESKNTANEYILKIAVANFSYLGTLAEPLKKRVEDISPNVEINFIERSIEYIEEITGTLIDQNETSN